MIRQQLLLTLFWFAGPIVGVAGTTEFALEQSVSCVSSQTLISSNNDQISNRHMSTQLADTNYSMMLNFPFMDLRDTKKRVEQRNTNMTGNCDAQIWEGVNKELVANRLDHWDDRWLCFL